MRIYLAILTSLVMAPFASAGGSLTWVEVSQRLTKECPKLLIVINQCFDVRPSGGALRLGPRSIVVIEGRAGVGDRVPPYEISDWDDGWKFIIREKQMKRQNSHDAPTGHKLFNFNSFSFQSRRWAHI